MKSHSNFKFFRNILPINMQETVQNKGEDW